MIRLWTKAFFLLIKSLSDESCGLLKREISAAHFLESVLLIITTWPAAIPRRRRIKF